ncbi:MAG: indole-3-glycerol phosphate synthase TrpC [Phycisphaerae bacterium]
MSNILDRILEHKHVEVAERKARLPEEELRARARDMAKPRNFFQAVSHKPTKAMNLIAEVKKASPSAGVIREDFDPVAIARTYAEAGADAISVLTDERFFHGSLDDLRAVRDAVNLPVLRKDFVVDAYQIWEARAAGADAVLLIAEALRTNELIDLQILATELTMTCLIEVHDMMSLMRVRDSVIGVPMKGYSLLGINNRDLTTFNVDLGTTLRMAELVENKEVLVTESGITRRDDVLKLAEAGVRAALVGESLMRSGDVAGAVREMFAPIDKA